MFSLEFYTQKLRLFIQLLTFNPSKIFLMFSIITTLLIIPMRFACMTSAEDVLIVLTIIFKSIFVLYLGRFAIINFKDLKTIF
jgi:hypothetical protein